MARLTIAERRILIYPPTATTWRCKASRLVDGEKIRCGQLCSGSSNRCWLCTNPRPKRPELVYPEYVAACKKAGIEPGERWRGTDPPKAAARKNVRRKGN